MAKLSVGISLNVDSTQTLGAAEFLKLRGETCIFAVACLIEYILSRFSKQFWGSLSGHKIGYVVIIIIHIQFCHCNCVFFASSVFDGKLKLR
jgi:hypothetical protein